MSTEETQTNSTGTNIAIAGLVIMVVAIAWWAYVYINGMGAKVSEAFACLVSSSGDCAIVNGLVEISGHTPYTPVVFWVGGAVWLVGMMVKESNA